MNTSAREHLIDRVSGHLRVLYPDAPVEPLVDAVLAAIGITDPTEPIAVDPLSLWSQSDVLMIAYGDSVTAPGEPPLRTLYRFLSVHLEDAISGVHILPFYPSSSDDGFAVIDYTAVDPPLGDWADISAIAGRFTLMGSEIKYRPIPSFS